MKIKKNLFILFLFICNCCLAHTMSNAIKLYDAGNLAFAAKNYRTADSLFSLSLDLEEHPDSYYNRAVCRRKMNDFKGYCLDLKYASSLNDRESLNLYWKQCAKRDTIYKKLNGDTAIKTNFELVEYITSYMYNTNFEYEKWDMNKDLLLSKIRKDNEIIYRACAAVKEPEYLGGMDSLIKYIKTKTDFLKVVKENNLAGVANFFLLIDENGNSKTAMLAPYEKSDAAIDELLKVLSKMRSWIPATFNERKVKFEIEVFFTYYDNELFFSFHPFVVKNKGVVSKAVEEMPEFPGGPVEMMRFISRNITYPQSAKEAGLEGKCFLKFVILPNGKITNIQVLKGVPKCAECDKEAIKVVTMMPLWKPGIQNGTPVPVFFNLPINFQLR